MDTQQLIRAAEAMWKTVCEPPWNKESLVDLGTNIFAKVPWEKLDQQTKLIFIKAVVNGEKAANAVPVPVKTEEVTQPETPKTVQPPKIDIKKDDKKSKDKNGSPLIEPKNQEEGAE